MTTVTPEDLAAHLIVCTEQFVIVPSGEEMNQLACEIWPLIVQADADGRAQGIRAIRALRKRLENIEPAASYEFNSGFREGIATARAEAATVLGNLATRKDIQ